MVQALAPRIKVDQSDLFRAYRMWRTLDTRRETSQTDINSLIRLRISHFCLIWNRKISGTCHIPLTIVAIFNRMHPALLGRLLQGSLLASPRETQAGALSVEINCLG